MQVKKSELCNEKISIFIFMKREIKLLPPELLENAANTCLKKPLFTI
jgi:hypothetical protein